MSGAEEIRFDTQQWGRARQQGPGQRSSQGRGAGVPARQHTHRVTSLPGQGMLGVRVCTGEGAHEAWGAETDELRNGQLESKQRRQVCNASRLGR